MNRFRFNNFIKRILVMLVLFFMISGQSTVFARAGGGGSSSGGGGASGGSHGSESHGSESSSGHYGRRSNPVDEVISIITFVVIGTAGTIIYKVKMGKKEIESIASIKSLSRNDDNWDYDNIKKDVQEAFYKVQLAWTERNQDIAKEYMSESLYNRHKTQTEWMVIRKEKNVLEDMKLLSARPIGLKDYEGIDRDVLWVYIEAKSKDYTINEETNKIVQGQDYKAVRFEEYWKFIRTETRWVLDEIRQKDEVGDLNFFQVKIDK